MYIPKIPTIKSTLKTLFTTRYFSKNLIRRKLYNLQKYDYFQKIVRKTDIEIQLLPLYLPLKVVH